MKVEGFLTANDREKAACKGKCEARRKSAEWRVCLTKAHRRHNNLVYTKRQKDIYEDRKHETTSKNEKRIHILKVLFWQFGSEHYFNHINQKILFGKMAILLLSLFWYQSFVSFPFILGCTCLKIVNFLKASHHMRWESSRGRKTDIEKVRGGGEKERKRENKT